MIRGLLLAFSLVAAGCRLEAGPGDRAWHDRVDGHRHGVEMGGYSLHYIDLGSGPPVVMVPGFADSTYCWHDNVPAVVAAGFRVILVDPPGLGRSTAPPAGYVYSVDNQAGEILRLVDRLGIDRFDLVGSSMGGGIAFYLGWSHPERVRKIVASAPAAFEPPGPRLTGLPGASLLASLFAGRWTLRRALQDVYFDDELVTETLVDEYARPFRKPGAFDVLVHLSRDYFSDAYRRMTLDYGELEPELLIVWGAEDEWIPPAYGERLHFLVPGSTLRVFPATGHLPHQERPAEFNRLLVDFLRHAACRRGTIQSS